MCLLRSFGLMIFNRGAVALCSIVLLVDGSRVGASPQKGHGNCGNAASTCEVRSVASNSEAARQAPFNANGSAAQAMPKTQQLDLAYRALFGDGSRVVFSSAGRQLYFEGGTIIWLGDTAVLVAPAADVAASAIATGALGVFYLKYVDQKFEVMREFPFAIDGSIGGNPPKWEISRDFTDLPVVVSTSSGGWQGIYCATTLLTKIGPDAPTDMISFRSAFDNSGNAPLREAIQSITSKMTNVRMNKSFDVEFSGTRTFTHRYENQSGNYEREAVGAAEELPEC